MRPRRLDASGVDVRGEVGGEHNLTRNWVGVSGKQWWGVSGHPASVSAVVVRVCRPRPADPNRASGEGEDGSDPPFLAAGAARRRRGCQARCQAPCQTPPPPFGGSLPSSGIHAGRLPGPHAGGTTSSNERRDA